MDRRSFVGLLAANSALLAAARASTKQGQGPIHGTAVAAKVVLAGLNRLAVDRVGLNVMEIPQNAVTYLNYVAWAGLGPANTTNVTLLGDTYVPYPFMPAQRRRRYFSR